VTDFRPRSERELLELSPNELIAYHREARAAARHDKARAALGILIWGFEDRVRYWVSRTTPKEHVDDVVQETIESAIRSSFDQPEVGQFGAWLRQIARRRVADFHDKEARRLKGEPLADEHERDEEIWGPAPETPDFADDVLVRGVLDQALGELNPAHRRVVELAGPKGLGFASAPAREAAERVNDQLSSQMSDPMTDVNVHQILSRFRKRVADLLSSDSGDERDG
jgi:RNA polymerase sigma factor (sigma-70 family)